MSREIDRRLRRVQIGRQLEASVELLSDRLAVLEPGVRVADEEAWARYLGTLQGLVAVLARLDAHSPAHLLTTGEMAERLGLAASTLLKHARNGKTRPALKAGKLIRWRGDERPSV